MKKYIKILLVLLVFFIPLSVKAISKDYKDNVYKIVNQKQEDGKVNLYLFHKKTCPHCKKEIEFLESIKSKYKDLNVYTYEISDSKENSNFMKTVKEQYKVTSNGVPFTVIGDSKFIGFSDLIGEQIEKKIQKYLEVDLKTENKINSFKLPLLGKVNVKEASVFVIALVLGLVDGFNPCAMWILLFLINMLFNMNNKKRMLLLGYTFLFTSALVYFLSMLGISVVLSIATINWIQRIIALLALVVGILNIKNYIKERNNSGCHVVDDKKRKKIFKKIQKFTTEKNLFLALIGVILLAVSVNLIELACSLGFPTIFSEILSINKITGTARIVYLLLYVLMYMIDDIIVFTIAVCTLSISTRSTKYTKYLNLIAGIIMIIMGILLLFKPEWIMFNF